MATSYISEHSAEFSLVPLLKEILERKFEYVVPLYPWAYRETSNISKSIHANDDFYILGMFPRRPKIVLGTDTSIYITINPELAATQKLGKFNGIPIIAGCPIANNFWELAKSKFHIWLSISNQMTLDYLIPLKILSNYKHITTLNIDNILDIVENDCVSHNVLSFEEFLAKVRRIGPRIHFGPRYKPVYFLMKNH